MGVLLLNIIEPTLTEDYIVSSSNKHGIILYNRNIESVKIINFPINIPNLFEVKFTPMFSRYVCTFAVADNTQIINR